MRRAQNLRRLLSWKPTWARRKQNKKNRGKSILYWPNINSFVYTFFRYVQNPQGDVLLIYFEIFEKIFEKNLIEKAQVDVIDS